MWQAGSDVRTSVSVIHSLSLGVPDWLVYIGIAIVVVIVAVMFLFMKKPKKAEDEEDELAELFEEDEI